MQNDHPEALRQMARLLLSLARLAERAAWRSAPVRFLVLFFLRPAAAVALVHVAACAPLVDVPDVPRGNGPDDALRLAETFCALAALVLALALDHRDRIGSVRHCGVASLVRAVRPNFDLRPARCARAPPRRTASASLHIPDAVRRTGMTIPFVLCTAGSLCRQPPPPLRQVPALCSRA